MQHWRHFSIFSNLIFVDLLPSEKKGEINEALTKHLINVTLKLVDYSIWPHLALAQVCAGGQGMHKGPQNLGVIKTSESTINNL